MNIAALAGWTIIAASVAWLLRERFRGLRQDWCPSSPPSATEVEEPASCAMTADAWCTAAEILTGSEIVLLNRAFEVAGAGECARREIGTQGERRHLLDIVPAEAVSDFLRGVSEARRGQRWAWRGLWRGRTAEAVAVPAGDGVMLSIAEVEDAVEKQGGAPDDHRRDDGGGGELEG